MATTVTLSQSDLQQLQNLYAIVYRSWQWQQLVHFLKDLDAKYGVSGPDAGTVNALAGHKIDPVAGQMTADANDQTLGDQYPFFP